MFLITYVFILCLITVFVMYEAIVISGTPGTGKTSVAKQLSQRLGWTYVSLTEVATNEGFIKAEDKERGTLIIDEELLRKYLRELIKSRKKLVVDSHYGEIIYDDLVKKIFVLRLNPRILLKRLRSRNYPNHKIKENLEAELVGTCTYNALSLHPGKVCEIDTTGKKVVEVVQEILDVLNLRVECRVWVDWLSAKIPEDVLKLVLR